MRLLADETLKRAVGHSPAHPRRRYLRPTSTASPASATLKAQLEASPILRLRQLLARGARRDRRAAEVRRPDSDGPQAGAARAEAVGQSARRFIDAASRISLELMRSATGDKCASLLAAIDRTVTGRGRARACRRGSRAHCPIRFTIDARLDAVGCLLDQIGLRGRHPRAAARSARSRARAARGWRFGRGGPRAILPPFATGSRLPPGVPSCSPRKARAWDCRKSWRASPANCARSSPSSARRLPPRSIDDPPHQRRDGGFVSEGFRADLDDARAVERGQPPRDGGTRDTLRRRDRHQVAQASATTTFSASISR